MGAFDIILCVSAVLGFRRTTLDYHLVLASSSVACPILLASIPLVTNETECDRDYLMD